MIPVKVTSRHYEKENEIGRKARFHFGDARTQVGREDEKGRE
jgi:hypothetical protein